MNEEMSNVVEFNDVEVEPMPNGGCNAKGYAIGFGLGLATDFAVRMGWKYVVKPGWKKLQQMKAEHKAKKAGDNGNVVEGNFREFDDDSEEKTE